MDEQLEAHLLGADSLATVAQLSQTMSSSTAPPNLELGNFLTKLQGSIPQGRAQPAIVATPLPRWPKQTWIPVPVAEVKTTRSPTVRELLARQTVGETPKEPTPEVSQNTALKSPLARKVFAMESGEQGSIPMETETQEEPIVPSSGMATNEPVIPTNLEHQIETMDEAATQEMVTLVTEETEPMGPPSIETRTIKTQRGNYVTIDTRVLEELGRMEVSAQGPTKLIQVASQPKPASGPAEVPSLVEVELVQTAQATTSQTASSMGNEEPAGDEQSSAQGTQREGHDTPDRDSGGDQGGDDEGGDGEAPPAFSGAPGTPGGDGGNGRKGGHGKGKQIGKQPAGKR